MINDEIIKVIEATEKATGLSAEQIAEEIRFPVALMKEAKRGIFPYEIFEGMFIRSLWQLSDEKELKRVDKILENAEKAERKALGITGTFERVGNNFFIKPLPKDE